MTASETRERPRDERPLPAHPYRDSALLHAALGLAVLLIAWLTGGGLARAVIVAAAYVLVATSWSWFRFRQRIARREEAERRAAARQAP